jgi:hypothetical protein
LGRRKGEVRPKRNREERFAEGWGCLSQVPTVSPELPWPAAAFVVGEIERDEGEQGSDERWERTRLGTYRGRK